ncbi:AfsR/SARP family transcriptional regulator [Amycolatopsis regifaucium]|uniref:SARP family transcriptional regulator n=1 Tax=Amycolatopsis regifaucium TaxID=546365 RepID=A0A154M5I1_9PSEU|nr:BTAD domain-containing putative transcriptional regulator [Amycolatopsis regifaucium]KZB79852.1 SARP family transcriptional regulator [Amycolatopsis regifaucium]OKA09831.1 SARP family transcriptional regulator [Amycolatopsis regifaucium]SFJ34137.1 DNA-binding transcriptional activator of the SARP family [Amycolatopsis regifaucium]
MEFRVLGPVQCRTGARPLKLAGPRQERILAALLLGADRVVSVSRLVDVVWGEDPPATAIRQIRNLTTALKRALVAEGSGEDVLTAEGPGFVLRPPVFDLRSFEEHASRGEFREALACWHGPALSGLDSPVLRGEADELDERRLSVVERCLDEEISAGEDRVAELKALVAEHPFREAFAGLLMRALHQQGRQADALNAYRQVQTRLVEELGIDPGPQLRELYERILRDEPEYGKARCFLPYDVPDFTGREAEIRRLSDAVRLGRPVVLDGMAGVGKTSLAVHAAHRLAADFPDGQLFVDLHGHSPGREPLPPEAALEALLGQLDVPASRLPGGVDRRAELWRTRTAGRSLLVVLDNAAGAEQLRPLLPGSATVALVVTGRRRLAAVDGAASISLEVLPDEQASVLFAAASGRPDAGVAALCGNLPLAIRIAAARLQHRPQWTVETLAERLGSEHDRLAELKVAGRDVAAAFALSYQELDADRQRMFRLLGRNPGTDIGVPAAAALAGVSESEAERLLEDLLDAHLLRQPSLGRYSFHDLIAEHARNAASDEESAPALGRLLDHYREGGGDGWYAAERANLVAVTRHAFDAGHDDHAWRIAENTAARLRESGRLDELLAVARTGVAAARRIGDPHTIQRSLADLTLAYWENGRLAEGMRCAMERLEVVRASADRAAEATALSRAGALHGMLGHYPEAIRFYREGLAAARGTDDPETTATLWINLSNVQETLGLLDEALASARRSVELREDPRNTVLSSAQLGLVLARLGRFEEAFEVTARSIGSARELGYLFGEAWSLVDHADALLLAHRPDEAREHAERACGILARLNHPLLLTMAANSLGTACLALGEATASLARHRLALETAKRIGYRLQEARALAGIGHARAALGEEADAEFRAARDHYAAMGLSAKPLTAVT